MPECVDARSGIAVFIISDEGIPREALVHFFKARPGYTVVGHCTVAEAGTAPWEAPPAVAIIHAAIPNPETLGLIKSLNARRIPVVVLLRQRYPWLVHAFRRAGATGLVLVEAMPSDLFGVVNAAAMHKRSVDPVLAGALFDGVPRTSDMPAQELSARESQVLRYLAYGYSHVQIARKLKVSTKSVETYRSRLMEKLDLKDRTDIVRFALITGVLSAGDIDDLAS